jgi:quinoprotein relay system zinc metallohydrolase 2
MDRCFHSFPAIALVTCALLAPCAPPAFAGEPVGDGAEEIAPAQVTEIAPGVYVRPGHTAIVFEDDEVANVGFVVGGRCVAVIDSGASEDEGRALQLAIRNVTPRPVCYVVDTHDHPDHVFGNKPFAQAGAQIVGHAGLARSLAQRAPTWLARASERAGRALGPADLAVPTVTVTSTLDLDLGDRTLRLTAHPSAHTHADLTVYDPRTATLWLGDLLFVGHVPVLDGSINGWIEVLAGLRAVGAERAVPGHGPPSVPWPAAAEGTLRYLTTLRDDLRHRIAAGEGLRRAQETAGYTEAARWQLFDAYHARNVAAAYAELEWE